MESSLTPKLCRWREQTLESQVFLTTLTVARQNRTGNLEAGVAKLFLVTLCSRSDWIPISTIAQERDVAYDQCAA